MILSMLQFPHRFNKVHYGVVYYAIFHKILNKIQYGAVYFAYTTYYKNTGIDFILGLIQQIYQNSNIS